MSSSVNPSEAPIDQQKANDSETSPNLEEYVPASVNDVTADAEAKEQQSGKNKAQLTFERSPLLEKEEIDQTRLNEILRCHAEWKKMVLDPKSHILSGRANFSSANISGLSFSSQDISYANFKNACCIGADFRFANAARANFSQANLLNADFRGADLRNAVFDGANLQNALFD